MSILPKPIYPYSPAQLKDVLHLSMLGMCSWLQRLHPEPQKATRFVYSFDPNTTRSVLQPCPVRDIGSVFDVATLSQFLRHSQFRDLMQLQLETFHALPVTLSQTSTSTMPCSPPGISGYPVPKLSGAMRIEYLDAHKIGEHAHIGHNGLLILSTLEFITACSSIDCPIDEEYRAFYHGHVIRLANGIVSQQQPSGALRIFFDANVQDFGGELYGGEALLALAYAYQLTREQVYLKSAEKALLFYKSQFEEGRIANDVLVFFANWQSQAASMLYKFTLNDMLRNQIENFVFSMYDTIFERGTLGEMEAKPEEQATVEVACLLEGLVDVLGLHLEIKGESPSELETARRKKYVDAVSKLTNFLLAVQLSLRNTRFAFGGLPHGFNHRVQRLDVTGHAICAFTKLWHVLDRHAHPSTVLMLGWEDEELRKLLTLPSEA